jgi:hypothetical protein
MRTVVLLITAAVLFLGSVEVWADGSWNADVDEGPTFIVSNAL